MADFFGSGGSGALKYIGTYTTNGVTSYTLSTLGAKKYKIYYSLTNGNDAGTMTGIQINGDTGNNYCWVQTQNATNTAANGVAHIQLLDTFGGSANTVITGFIDFCCNTATVALSAQSQTNTTCFSINMGMLKSASASITAIKFLNIDATPTNYANMYFVVYEVVE